MIAETNTSTCKPETNANVDRLAHGELDDLVAIITERLTKASDKQLRALLQAVFTTASSCGPCGPLSAIGDTNPVEPGASFRHECSTGNGDQDLYLIVDESRGPASGEFSVRVLRSYGSFTLTDPLPSCLQTGPPVRRMHHVPQASDADRYTLVRHGSLLLEAVAEYHLTTSTHAAKEGVSTFSEPGTVISARKWSSMRKIPSVLVEERWTAEEGEPTTRDWLVSGIMTVLAEGQQVLLRTLRGDLRVLDPVKPGTGGTRFVRLR